MQVRNRLQTATVVIIGAILLSTSTGLAEWSEPENLTELNGPEIGFNAKQACISSDGLSIFFVRYVPSPDSKARFQLFEAVRDDVSGVFGAERALTELNPLSRFIDNPWISTDGLRLYYAHVDYSSGTSERYLKMAVRNSPEELWQPVRTFHELHINTIIDTALTLTEDERTIVYISIKEGVTPYTLLTATRESIDSPFSAPVELPELTAAGVGYPHLSGEGLRIYFTAAREDNGKPNLYTMSRPSLNEPFANIKHLDGLTDANLAGNAPHLSPDEKTIYFYGGRNGLGGTWVSYWIVDPLTEAIDSIEAAIEDKKAAIALIGKTLEKETTAIEALNELRDIGDTDPVKILQSKTSIFKAIHRQLKARSELQRAIGELEKSLKQLQAPDKPKRNNGRNSRAPAGRKLKERPRK